MKRYALEFEVELEEGMSEMELEAALRDGLSEVGIEVQDYVDIRELYD